MRRALLCFFGRHAWGSTPMHGGRYMVTRCAHCRRYRMGPDGNPVMMYIPLPPRAQRRRMERGLGKAVERRVQDDAMMSAADRELAKLQELLK